MDAVVVGGMTFPGSLNCFIGGDDFFATTGGGGLGITIEVVSGGFFFIDKSCGNSSSSSKSSSSSDMSSPDVDSSEGICAFIHSPTIFSARSWIDMFSAGLGVGTDGSFSDGNSDAGNAGGNVGGTRIGIDNGT